MRLSRDSEGKNAVDLLEEAVLLLRRLPFLGWARLYLGALPYVLVLLLYLMNLAHNPAVSEELVGYSALLAILFVWMKLWQTLFAAEVWRLRSGTSVAAWTLRSVFQIVSDHLRYSAASLIGLAVSALLVFPLAWSYALHQNLVLQVLPGLEGRDSRAATLKRSWQQARLWPGQNHLIMLLLGLISLFAFVNFAACLVFFPYLVKVLTGWESTFTRLGVRLLDFKMFITALVLTYLAILPLTRVVYVLRCFYGASQATGADLLSELRSHRVAGLVLVFVLFVGAGHGFAMSTAHDANSLPSSVPNAASSISPARLDAAINSVLQNRKHLWQAPSHARKSQESSVWRDIGRALERWLEKLAGWLDRLLRWLRPASSPVPGKSGASSVDIRDLAVVLLVGGAVALAVLVVRALLERRSRVGGRVPERPLNPVDLRRPELSPEELPEEEWLNLAREMMESGQARLAVRAVYLAAVVVLGKRELVTPTRFKSNRDYLAELKRRQRGSETPVTNFQSMVGMFEKVWYGRHEAGPADFEEMHRLLTALRA